MLATLILSQGVPMLLAGDEMGRSQSGNNNTYCHDNDLSWIDWDLSETNQSLLHYSQRLIQLLHDHPVLRRRNWFYGREIHGSGVRDIGWFNVEGETIRDEWDAGFIKTLTVFLNGEEIATPSHTGKQVLDDSFLLMFNAHYDALSFALPEEVSDRRWRLLIDTKSEGFVKRGKDYRKTDQVMVAARSLVVLQSFL